MATVVASPKTRCEALKNIVFRTAEDMKEVHDGTADLVITSPPYVGHHSQGERDNERKLTSSIFMECARIVAPRGVVGSYNTDFKYDGAIYARHMVVIEEARRNSFKLIAEKIHIHSFGRDLYRMRCSFVLVFCREKERPKVNHHIPEFERDVWVFEKNQHVGEFRDAIPPEVPVILIQNFTYPSDLVVAPCAGSGTAVIAALKMGRKSIGYEIDRARIPVIKERERRFREYFSDEGVAKWLSW